MPKIRPFRALRYNRDVVKNISKVVAPPYDIIPPKLQNELYGKHPNNIIRLILGKIKKADNAKDNRYNRAAKLLDGWVEKGILICDKKPAVYIYTQRYKYGGKIIDRFGFVCRMGLDLGRNTKVLPHENTLLAPKLDRLSLTRATRCNLSPIFVLYEDKGRKVASVLRRFISKNKPEIDVDFQGVNNKMWVLDDPEDIKKIEKTLDKSDVFIADGHHRYEVARMYAREVEKKDLSVSEKESSKYVLAYFVESEEKALTVLPAHRVAKDIGGLSKAEAILRLEKFFSIEKMSTLSKMMSRLEALSGSHTFGMYMGGKDFLILSLKDVRYSDNAIKNKPKDWKRLDVSILHLFIFQNVLGISDSDDNIDFFKSPEETAAAVRSGKFKIAFFLNPTKAWQVRRIAHIGERMPRKATYFYPKPVSGLVINKH
ncbi:MAG: DUF1015 domain-containing protein [Candidatus Omnitrophota bacterium]